MRYQRWGKKHEMGLGPYPAVSLSEARQKTRDAQTLLYQGLDPLAEKRKKQNYQRRRDGTRFSEVAKRYIEEHACVWTNAKHASDWATSLERYVYPILDSQPLTDLTTEDVIKVLKPIWSTKHETARKIQGRMKLVFGYALTAKLYEGSNPSVWQDHLSHFFANQNKHFLLRHHRALPYCQMPEFYKCISDQKTQTSQALQFTILTAGRTSEVRSATLQEFDLDKQIWRVPATRMKARRPHDVPLSDTAVQLIERAKRSSNAPFIFHGQNPEKPLSNMAMLSFVKKRLSSFDTTVHGLRSTFRTWAGEKTDYSSGVIEFALAHQLNQKIEGAYMRSDLLEARRPLMQDWDYYVTGRA